MSTSPAVTTLLQDWNQGDNAAFERLACAAYQELRRMASGYLRREHLTLQPTELVNEIFLRLNRTHSPRFNNSSHFYGACAQIMRRVLVDLARRRDSAKRGATMVRITLSRVNELHREPDLNLIALDRALDRLAELDPDQARLVELRYFGGLEITEAAAVLGVSVATVKREWALARTWLWREMTGECPR